MKAIIVLIAFLFFLHFAEPAFAAGLVINEFSSASNPEWVEIYNSDEQTYSLQGVVLFFDGTSITQKVSFCDNDEVSAKSYKLITRPVNSFWLSNNGDTLILKKEDDIIDSISYGSGQSLGAPTSAQSISRIPDGGSLILNNSPSPQGNEASFVCPTPTPVPSTPTPVPPTNTPIPPTPTRTLTPTPTKIPTPTNTPTSKLSASPTSAKILPTSILGESTESGPTVSPTDAMNKKNVLISNKSKNPDNNFQKVLILLGIVFVAACVILTIREIKKRKLSQNE